MIYVGDGALIIGYFIKLYRLAWSCGSTELDGNSNFKMTINGEQFILIPCVACTVGD